MTESSWTVAEAKAKLSEVIEKAQTSGPQRITRHGKPAVVVVSAEEGQPTVKSQNDARKAELKTGVRADPLVQAVLARFPGAEIVDVRKGAAVISSQSVPGDSGEETPEP